MTLPVTDAAIPDANGVGARLAFSILQEAFLDMAVALGRIDPDKAGDLITALEINAVARLKSFGDAAGPASVPVQRNAAASVREVTKEAKQRIAAARTRN
ncbi:hypothetical protein SAMN05216548_10427 [Faunimonas pinastri]|uniref:Uncharacterized protein n=1 Tax=Faunimonas pinastri TaxID=1855383 RepID=A0A1H9F7K6_9HYPH|nr:hypothetical protein SAMN05216548_10427 [Faunimonas pinastri]